MSENFAMSFSPLPFVVDDDSNVRWPQFPMNNELFDQLPPLKRPRISSESSHFDLSHQPNMNPRNMQNPQNHVTNNRGGTSHIFYKTRLCAKFRMGTCRNGESCNFAHGNEDVRQPPANWQELVGVRDEDKSSANWDDDQKIIHKMKLCKKYYNGEECPYGERCSFLHEDPSKFRDDAGRCRDSSVISVVANGSPKSHMNGNNNAENIKSVNNGFDGFRTNGKSFWKTKLCTKWETTGLCPFGDKCHFAHGHAELQMPNGRTDSEAIGAAFSIPVNDASPITDVVMLDSNEDELKKKNLLKWKISKKVNRIYADWPDNLPSPRQLV